MDIWLNLYFWYLIKCRGSIGTGLRIAPRGLVLSFEEGTWGVVAIPYLKLAACSPGYLK